MTVLVRDRYEPIEVVGQGGEGRLLKAIDRQHDRVVALKVRAVHDESEREQLLHEARLLLGVAPHPNLPLVREDFFDGDQYVIAMDWIEGTDLAKLLRRRGRPGLAPSSVLRWLADAASALTHLHTQDPPRRARRRQAGQPRAHHGWAGRARRLRLVVRRRVLRRRHGGTRWLTPRRSSPRACPPRGRATSTRWPRPPSHCSPAPRRCGIRPEWEGIDPAAGRAARSQPAAWPGDRPCSPAGDRRRARRAAARRVGLDAADGRPHVLPHRHRGLDRAVGGRPGRHGSGAGAPRRARRGRRGSATAAAASSRWVKATPPCRCSRLPSTRSHAAIELQQRLPVATDGTDGEPMAPRVRVALHTGEAEQRGGDYVGATLNIAAQLRGLADGGQIVLSGDDGLARRSRAPGRHDARRARPAPPARAAHHRAGLRALGARASTRHPPATVCPYPGLPAFEREDADRFFGRDGGGRRPRAAPAIAVVRRGRRCERQRQVVGPARRAARRVGRCDR